MALFCLHLLFKLSTFLFFDLLHGFQEKLLNVRALVENHLTNRFQVATFLILLSDRFVEILKLLMLLTDNLLVLKLKKLAFFFEISYDLAETFFKKLDLCL